MLFLALLYTTQHKILSQPNVFDAASQPDNELANFLPSMLCGLEQSRLSEAAIKQVWTWIGEGKYVPQVTYLRKKGEIKPWLEAPREKVRAFAHNQTLSLEWQIADKQCRVEQGLELRNRNYGE